MREALAIFCGCATGIALGYVIAPPPTPELGISEATPFALSGESRLVTGIIESINREARSLEISTFHPYRDGEHITLRMEYDELAPPDQRINYVEDGIRYFSDILPESGSIEALAEGDQVRIRHTEPDGEGRFLIQALDTYTVANAR